MTNKWPTAFGGDLPLWFALLSPLIGALLGLFGVFILYH